MAKSTKYTAKVPKLEDYKPSWLKEVDGEQVVDVDAALKAAHTLTLDKAKAQDAREDAVAEKAEVETEKVELQTKLDDKNAPDAQVEIDKAKKRADAAEATAAEAVAAKTRLEVIVAKELTPKQAKYLPKDGTQEELEEAADEIKVDFPSEAKVEETDEQREAREEAEAEAALAGRTSPVTKTVVNPADPKSNVPAPVDFEKAADQILSGQFRLV